jgi:hypothetical protein
VRAIVVARVVGYAVAGSLFLTGAVWLQRWALFAAPLVTLGMVAFDSLARRRLKAMY